MNNIEELVTEIGKILGFLQKKEIYGGYDGDTLTISGMKLSTLKVTLGNEIAAIEQQYELMEVQYGIDEANQYLALRNGEGKTSIDDAKMMVRIKLEQAKIDLVKIKTDVSKFKVYHRNVSDVITNIQTRVSYLKQERNENQLNK